MNLYSNFKSFGGSKELYSNYNLVGATVLIEHHFGQCKCSYCINMYYDKNRHSDCKGTWGYSSPECKYHNSWRRLHIRYDGELYILRWTMPIWLNKVINRKEYAK